MSEQPRCELCGEPMPPGEEMFKYHGYSGPCPKPPLARPAAAPAPEGLSDAVLLDFWRSVQGPKAGLTGPLIRYAALIWAVARARPALSDDTLREMAARWLESRMVPFNEGDVHAVAAFARAVLARQREPA